MARGVYTVPFAKQAVATSSGDVDLWELTPADDKPIEIVGICIDPISEVGDAQEEILDIQVIRGFTASGSGGSSATPAPTATGGGASGFSAEILNTTVATTGTSVTLDAFGVNVRVGRERWYPPEARISAGQGDTTIVVRLATALVDDATISGNIWVRELP